MTLSPNGVDKYQDARRPDVLLVATTQGVVELRHADGAWPETGRSLEDAHVSSLYADSDGLVFAGSHGSGIYRRHGDDAWMPHSSGLTSQNVYSLSYCDSAAGAVLFAGTEPAFLFRRGIGEDAWEELDALRAVPGREGWNFPSVPHVAHTKHIDIDPRDDDTFYVSIEQGALLKTRDGGRTFRQLTFKDDSYIFNSDAHRVVINPLNPDEIYLPGGDGIAHSRDGGETWERVATPSMRVSYPDATFCSPLEDGVLYAAGAGGRPHSWRTTGSADAAMVRSRDRGRTWAALPLPELRGNIEAVSMLSWPDGYGFFVGTTDGEVFESTDRGETWSQIAGGLPPISKGGHYKTVLSGRTAVGEPSR